MKIFRLFIALILTGCASAGTDFSWQDAKKMEKGMTPTQVTAIMGKPNTVRVAGENTVWAWSHVDASPFGASSKVVSVTFKGGVVASVPEIPFK